MPSSHFSIILSAVCLLARPGACPPVLQEIDALLDLDNPHVISLHEYFVQQNKVFLIMELLQGGWLGWRKGSVAGLAGGAG